MTNKPNETDALNRLAQRVKDAGLKLTTQRTTILSAFIAHGGHRSAEEILAEVRKIDPKVSLTTVYRTLKILQEYGLATAHNFQDGQARFEPASDEDHHHDHLICTSCQKIVEFMNEEIEELQLKVASAHGFVVEHHKMELYGLCAKCQKSRQE
jgi:Fur family ferric uptake transcriptional regulator